MNNTIDYDKPQKCTKGNKTDQHSIKVKRQVLTSSVRRIFGRVEGEARSQVGKGGKNQSKAILIPEWRTVDEDQKKVFTQIQSVFLPRFKWRPNK